MKVSDLEQVLDWRNHPEIRRFMFTRHEIMLDEHSRWFEQVSQEKWRHLFIFEVEGVPSGFVNITEVVPNKIADWGFYTRPGAVRGTGRKLGYAVFKYVFNEMKLHRLCGQAVDFNKKSINFHLSLGFKQEGVLREHYFDGDRFHDVLLFGLLANEWQTTCQAEVV